MRRRISFKLSVCAGAVLAAAAVGAVWYFRSDSREREIGRLKEIVARLETERRVAEVLVVGQWRTREGALRTRFRFAETAPGRPPAAREFEIEGDVAYFDALVVKFDREYLKAGDALRGRSIYVFRRVFGEYQEPSKGFPLDPFDQSGVPAAYRLGEVPSDFEREIWRDFWGLALDPGRAKAMGVRVLQGEAVYARLAPGKLYRLAIEDAGGLNLTAEDLPVLGAPLSADSPRR